MKELLIVKIFFVFILSSCARKASEENYIARVENEYLLKKDVAGMDTNFVRPYIESWVNNNLLYQEALERGYKSDENIERLVNEFRKSLVVKNFLQREVFDKANNFSVDDLKKFYEQHQDEFLLDKAIVKIGYVKFTSRTDADKFRSFVLKGRDFKKEVKNMPDDIKVKVVEFVEERYFDQFNIPSPEVWRIAWNLSKGEISFPVRAGNFYYLVYLYDKKDANEKADFELVADEIKERFIVERQNELLDSLLASLKRKYTYEIKW